MAPCSSAPCPPKIKDGYLSREAIYEFFSQTFEEPNLLRQHAGRLHARLIKAVWFRKIVLETRCQDCGGGVRARSCISKNSSHMDKKELRKMEISVSSLNNLTIPEFKAGVSQVGPGTLGDFELLSDSLRKNL
jgi:hypothetical protein